MNDPCAVNDNVQAAEALYGRGDRLSDAVTVGNVARAVDGVTAIRSDFISNLLSGRIANIRNDDGSTFIGKYSCGRCTNPGSAAADPCHLSCQSVAHPSDSSAIPVIRDHLARKLARSRSSGFNTPAGRLPCDRSSML